MGVPQTPGTLQSDRSLDGHGLAVFACRPEQSRGRRHQETESHGRTVHQRDRDRIVHSGAFRKLKYKTQVFVYHEGDYYRTRLSHSLEVAQIARSICRVLRLNEDLAEAVALAHDLGHTPFGHAGERALDAAMVPYGGFSHNEQTIRILTRLERRYAEFDGLNLTWESLEGVVKHNGPLIGGPLTGGGAQGETDATAHDLPVTIAEVDASWPLGLDTWPGAEAQVASLADDIAYNNHDLDDGLRAGLFTIEEIAELPLVGPIVAAVQARYPNLERPRLVHETIRRLIDTMVGDLLIETGRRLLEIAPAHADDIRAAGRATVAFGPEIEAGQQPLRAFLRARMYRHYRVNRAMSKSRRVMTDLFALFMAEPDCLPTEWQEELSKAGPTAGDRPRARLVADYIAGMTDRYALLEHERLFNPATGT